MFIFPDDSLIISSLENQVAIDFLRESGTDGPREAIGPLGSGHPEKITSG